jgi:hypothetical protein
LQPRIRRAYNATYSDARFARYTRALEASLGCEVGFRLAETPVFFPRDLAERCGAAARQIVAQLAAPERSAALARAVPAAFEDEGAGRSALPQFAVVDFAIARAPDGTLEPQLVELQGFPSLLAFEILQSDAWLAQLETVEDFDAALAPWFGDFDRASALALARRAIVGEADPAETVLLDIQPATQKTHCDFAATEKLFGVTACDPSELYARAGRLYRRDAAGREIPVARIYNRIVGDDLTRPGFSLPFDPRRVPEVTWAPHPRWFWAWSKAALPHLDHPAVPRTRLLSEVDAPPEDLSERYVLKPLFSFAGSGVNVRPSPADFEAIAEAERDRWCLQEKIDYAPALETPERERVKIEMRVMLLRPDDEAELVPLTNLCRLSRGDMIGVDYNRNRTWVGSSIGLW